MADVITTLHPEGAPEDNLYPNVKDENIPSTIARKSDLDYSLNTLLSDGLRFTTTFDFLARSSFTLTKRSIVQVRASYSNVPPKVLAVGSNSSTTNPSIYDLVECSDVDPGMLALTTILEPGTYGLWGKSTSQAYNDVTIKAWELGD